MKYQTFTTKGLLLLVLFFFSALFAEAQSQETNYNRFSLSLSGGLSAGNPGEGTGLMESVFNIRTETTPAVGAGLQYAVTPEWSLEAGYGYRQIRDEGDNFETLMHQITLKNILNLNQLFSMRGIATSINPFVSVGVGYDLLNYESSSEQFNTGSISYNVGAGLAVKLTNRFDLFTHYEYHVVSNSADNIGGGNGFDLLNTLTGGVRINFGKKDAKHPSWRQVPVEVRPRDYEQFVAQTKEVERLNEDVGNLKQEIDQKDEMIRKLRKIYQEDVDSLENRITELEKRNSKLKEKIKELKVDKETGIVETLPAGHYVQIFASLTFEDAQRVKDVVFKKLEEHFDISIDRLIITKRKKFYEVSIGVFQNFDEAQKIQNIVQEEYSDAFIITFPRPVDLQDDFKGLQIVG